MRVVLVLVFFLSSAASTAGDLISEEWTPVWFGSPFITKHSNAVGLLRSDIGGNCSGVLISEDLFLTASHCIRANQCSELSVEFLYQFGHFASKNRIFDCHSVQYRCGHSQDGYAQCDLAIIKLSDSPGNEYGYLKVSTDTPESGEEITIIHHPYSISKVYSVGEVEYTVGNFQVHNIRLARGSSGAPLLNDKGEIIGVHSKGGDGTSSIAQASLVNGLGFDLSESKMRFSKHYASMLWSGWNSEVIFAWEDLNIFGETVSATYTGVRIGRMAPFTPDIFTGYSLGSSRYEITDYKGTEFVGEDNVTSFESSVNGFYSIHPKWWVGAGVGLKTILREGLEYRNNELTYVTRGVRGVLFSPKICNIGTFNGYFNVCIESSNLFPFTEYENSVLSTENKSIALVVTLNSKMEMTMLPILYAFTP